MHLSRTFNPLQGTYTVEPSFNFTKKSPALAVTKKLGSKDTLKLAYDLKSENATAEWNHKPFKVTINSKVSKKLSVGKPTVSAIFENVSDGWVSLAGLLPLLAAC